MIGAGHNESISEIAKDPQKGGADRAYQQLRSEVIGITGAYDNNAAKQRMAEATADMEANGVLPQMSASWLKNEFSRIDTSGNGKIERSELDAAKEDQTRFGGFDGKFASTVDTELFDKLAKYDLRNGEENISKSALDRYLRQDDRNNQKAIDQEEAKDALAPLYEGPDPLINYLNKDGNRRVSRREMKEFLDDYEKFQGTGPYTERNAEFVKDLMHRDIPELHTGITTGFSAKHTAQEMGLDSAHNRKHKDFSLAQEDFNNERTGESLSIPSIYDRTAMAATDSTKHGNGTTRESDESKPADNAPGDATDPYHPIKGKDTNKPKDDSTPTDNVKPTDGSKPADNANPTDSSKPADNANPPDDKAVGQGNDLSNLSTSGTHVSDNADHDRAKMQGWIKEMERKVGQIKNQTHDWGDIRKNFPHPNRNHRRHEPLFHPPFHPQIHY